MVSVRMCVCVCLGRWGRHIEIYIDTLYTTCTGAFVCGRGWFKKVHASNESVKKSWS